MLRVYHSNRLDVLEALMEFIVERERLDDPFEQMCIRDRHYCFSVERRRTG